MSAKIMGAVFDLKLPRAQKAVLLALADHADHDGHNAHPGVGLLVHKTGYCERAVQYALTALLKAEIITADANAEGGRGKGTVYSIWTEKGAKTAPNHARKGAKTAPIETLKGASSDTERVQVATLKGASSDTSLNLIEPSLEPSLEPKECGTLSVAADVIDDVAENSAPDKTPSTPPSPGYAADMIAFWEQYPSAGRARGSRSETQTAWKRLCADDRLSAAQGLAAALRHAQFRDYPPAPHRWLAARRWETFLDVLTEPPSPPGVPGAASPSAPTSALAAASEERAARLRALRGET